MTEIDNIQQQKDLAKKILEEYAKQEEKRDTSDTYYPYLYYCHTEFDSRGTMFEALSNSNKIVVKSKINYKYMPIIMQIFHNIFEDNYWMLSKSNEEGFIFFSIEDDFFKLTEEELNRLNNYDFNEWINFLEKYSNRCKIRYNNGEKSVDEERIFDEIPTIDTQYFPNSKDKQKVYTLLDIANLIV